MPSTRVKPVDADKWARARKEKFSGAIDYAARAKAARTLKGVTQTEMANWFGVSLAVVGRWESGYCLSWNEEDMGRWLKAVAVLSK
jgi:DNA-binding transcriptional regulator YiaG